MFILFGVLLIVQQVNSVDRKLALAVLRMRPANMVVSTLAVKFSLAKLASVAQGQTKTELMQVLGFTKEEMIELCYDMPKYRLVSAQPRDLMMYNRLYVNYTDAVNTTFMQDPRGVFGITVDKVGFNYPISATDFINRWISTATRNHIPNVVSTPDINKNTTMIIVNGLYFKGAWEHRFYFEDTAVRKFRHFQKANISHIPMMAQSDSFYYLDDEENDVKIIMIYYEALGFRLVVVLPNENDGLPEFLRRLDLNPKILDNLSSRMKPKSLRVVLPILKIKTYIDWTGFLQEMGLNQIFNITSSGLENILNNYHKVDKICLNSVKQRVFFEMDENGPYRMADGFDGERKRDYDFEEFVADHPFFFMVQVELDQPVRYPAVEELFTGVYYGPDE